MDLRKIKKRREVIQKKLIKIAEEYGKDIKSILGKVTIILYGSVAKGDFNKGSDIDILVISDELPKKFIKRFDLLLSKAKAGIEPKGYTTKEFDEIKDKPNFKEMLAKKIILLDDLQLFG